jgi:2-methylcitrate dehydratase PrpD
LPILLIDWYRAGAVGIRQRWTRHAKAATVELSAQPTCRIMLSRDRADPVRAAYQNGVVAGSLDWDDSHIAALVHPGVVVWPAAIAAAEVVGASGRELLDAALVGYEVAVRVGVGLQPDHSLRGFQATPTCGIFGATVAAGRLLGLDQAGLQNALAIAASYSSGSSQFFLSGSDIKRLHAGKGAAAGVEIAYLVKAGLTGPHDAIEGDQGFARAVSDTVDCARMVEGLGTRYWLDEIALKIHAGTVRLQSAIEASQELAARGIKPDAIAKVVIGVPKVLLGKVTSNDPVDMQQAQMSAPFASAMTFVLHHRTHGPLILGIDEFAALVNDPVTRALSAKATCVLDAEIDAGMTAGRVPARVTVTLHDGSEHTAAVFYPKGCRENPITDDEVCERAITLLRAARPDKDIPAWIELVKALADQPTLNEVLL